MPVPYPKGRGPAGGFLLRRRLPGPRASVARAARPARGMVGTAARPTKIYFRFRVSSPILASLAARVNLSRSHASGQAASGEPCD